MKNQKDFGSGLLFIIVGLFFGLASLRYEMGTLSNMNAGYMPLVLGIALCVLGLFIVIRSFHSEETKANINWKIAFYITGLLVLFVVVFKSVGGIVAAVLLVYTSAYIHKEFNFKKTTYAAIVVVFSVLVFKFLLGSEIPLWIS